MNIEEEYFKKTNIGLDEENKKINYDDIIQSEDGFLIFNPYNLLNVEIKKENIEEILQKYGLPPVVNNLNLYKRAFVHRSYTKRPIQENALKNIKIINKPDDCVQLSTKSNERLEFLGDGVLELVTKYYLYRRFPKENEGFMTEKKIKIVKNETIGRIAYEMGLHKWFILSKNAEEKKTRINLKKLGCLFESFIGAVYLDFDKIHSKKINETQFQERKINDINDDDIYMNTGLGFQYVQLFIENIFEKHINWIDLICNDDNYKNILQVKIQKEFKTTPYYLEINYDSDEGFEMGVFLALNIDIHNYNMNNYVLLSSLKNFKYIQEYYEKNGSLLLLMGIGKHKIKRKAEMTACFQALKILDENILI